MSRPAKRELALPIPTREQIEALLTDQYGDPQGAELVEGGLAHYRTWLSELNDGEIGMLSIGLKSIPNQISAASLRRPRRG
jgi:hypothetical protein